MMNPFCASLRRATLNVGLMVPLLMGCARGYPQCVEAPPAPPPPPDPNYLLIESQMGAAYGLAPEVEVRGTPLYSERRSLMRTVAIRLPDSCNKDTVSSVTGAGTRADTIVQTRCGVWLSELERSFASAGFRVMSWDALQQSGADSYASARKMGADVVFVFNSLDVSEIRGGTTSSVAHRYYHSDREGNKGAPYLLQDSERAGLRNYAESLLRVGDGVANDPKFEAKLEAWKSAKAAGLPVGDPPKPEGRVEALSSTLDSTAIATDTGESVWFYRYTATKPVVEQRGMRFLFELRENRWYPSEPAQGAAAPVVATPQTASAEDVQHTAVAAGHQDQYAKERLQLVRAAAIDFVERFKSGNLGGGGS
jgi:hypothetical protein